MSDDPRERAARDLAQAARAYLASHTMFRDALKRGDPAALNLPKQGVRLRETLGDALAAWDAVARRAPGGGPSAADDAGTLHNRLLLAIAGEIGGTPAEAAMAAIMHATALLCAYAAKSPAAAAQMCGDYADGFGRIAPAMAAKAWKPPRLAPARAVETNCRHWSYGEGRCTAAGTCRCAE